MTWAADSILLVGCPSAGKTNYLARVWLEMRSDRGPMRIFRLPRDAAYVQQAANALLQGRYAPRTDRDLAYKPVELSLTPTSSGGESGRDVVLADGSGEYWYQVFDRRLRQPGWEKHLRRPLAILLFYRASAEENVAPLDWISYQKLVGLPPTKGEGQAPPAGSVSAENLPTQVVLVEAAQLLLRAATEHGVRHIRLGVVVTGWDAIPTDGQTTPPLEYLRKEMPLLTQFIEANPSGAEVRTFGVSSTGGDLAADGEFRAKYLEHPTAFGYAVASNRRGGIDQNANVAFPILWAAGGDG